MQWQYDGFEELRSVRNVRISCNYALLCEKLDISSYRNNDGDVLSFPWPLESQDQDLTNCKVQVAVGLPRRQRMPGRCEFHVGSWTQSEEIQHVVGL